MKAFLNHVQLSQYITLGRSGHSIATSNLKSDDQIGRQLNYDPDFNDEIGF